MEWQNQQSWIDRMSQVIFSREMCDICDIWFSVKSLDLEKIADLS